MAFKCASLVSCTLHTLSSYQEVFILEKFAQTKPLNCQFFEVPSLANQFYEVRVRLPLFGVLTEIETQMAILE